MITCKDNGDKITKGGKSLINKIKKMNQIDIIYFMIIALGALALGFSHNIMSNYFKDAYNITAYQRGLIEFPRELPGVLVIFMVALLSSFSDIKVAMVAQIFSIIGISVLGFLTPSFNKMLIFIFINSMGMHLLMPVQDSIGISLIKDKNIGKRMGQYKGTITGCTMLSSIIVFIGFKVKLFSFTSQIKWIFIVCAFLLFVVFILYALLKIKLDSDNKKDKKFKFIFRKEYKYYYTLVVMWGVQKQIMLVYGPWVLIDILNKKTDTLALLNIIGAFVGMFFIPKLGKWIDKFGLKKMLFIDAISFIVVYLVYGLLSAGFAKGYLSIVGVPVLLAYALFILDKMSTQMGMIRTIYLKSIAIKDSDITPTLSLGLSIDHVVSITCAYVGGIVWMMWGPQYIFFLASFLSLINLYVATKVKSPVEVEDN